MKEQLYFFKNRFQPFSEVRVSPEDRGYYFGDGVYEVFRVYNGKLFEADAHFDRLERTRAFLQIVLPQTKEAMLDLLNKLIKINKLHMGTVYLQITRGEAPRAHPFPAQTEPVMLAYTTVSERPLKKMQHGITSVTKEDIRWLRCDLKTLNLLPNVLAKQYAINLGADEVIMYRSGVVTECSSSNFMMVKNGTIWTHPANHLILHGITRAVIFRLANKLDIAIHEEPFTLEQLKQADEAFISGTTTEVTPVISIDGQPVADGIPGGITRKIQKAFETLLTSNSG